MIEFRLNSRVLAVAATSHHSLSCYVAHSKAQAHDELLASVLHSFLGPGIQPCKHLHTVPVPSLDRSAMPPFTSSDRSPVTYNDDLIQIEMNSYIVKPPR